MNILLLIGGLVLLFIGGEFLVRGAATLASRLGMSPLLIGLTVVAFGTSSPELVVSLDAAVTGSPGIAVGNVVGSNIANLLLIMGVGALIRPVPSRGSSLIRDGGMLVLATLATIAIAYFAAGFAWWHGVVMLLLLAGYIMMSYAHETRAVSEEQVEAARAPGHPLWLALSLTVLGLAGLVAGAEWLIEGAVTIASTIGVSDEIIGATVVAIGTSVPELAIVSIAAARGHTDMVFGNVVGSNIFNCLCILGITTLVVPVPVDWTAIGFDMLVMGGVTALLLVLTGSGRRLSRPEGSVLLLMFAGYVAINYLGKPVLAGAG